jgi:hypothetical protein
MDLNILFHWIFPSPGYFLLTLAGLLVLFGLIGGLTDTRKLGDAHNSPPDEGKPQSGMPGWRRDDEAYREWNAHQVREHHRIAGKHSFLD